MNKSLKELATTLNSSKLLTRKDMHLLAENLYVVSEELITAWSRLNIKVNKITAQDRHGNKISDKHMTELCNRQLLVENIVDKIRNG